MKKEKIKTIAIVVMALIIVFGGSYFASELKKGTGEITDNTEEKEYKEITIADYLELLNGSEASIIYIARPTCGYCQQQDPIMKQVASEYDLTINYLNTDTFAEDDYETLVSSNSYFDEGFGTPTTIIVKNNEFVAESSGLTQKDALVDLFTENGLIATE